jgi:hypothetical protein
MKEVTERKTSAKSTRNKLAVQCSASTFHFVAASRCGESPALQVAANRYVQP